MAAIKIPTAFNIDLEYETGDFGRRLVAWLIDLAIRIVYLLAMWAMAVRITYVSGSPVIGELFQFWVQQVPMALYFLIFELAWKGQSPGKKIMHLKVVSLSGNQPGFSQYMIRWVFRIIETPFLLWFLIPYMLDEYGSYGVYLGIFLILISPAVPVVTMIRSKYNQRLGDLVAGTMVVSTKTKSTLDDTIFREVSQTDYKPQFPQILRLSDKDLNKVKELLDMALRTRNLELAAKVSYRVRDVLKIETEMDHIFFLETLLNDYNYYVTKDQ
ncbi:RDD family protein [Chitinophaga agrisoli]|uniref:RDD family protein n=1 Tax=Chitinophaga agrisoli TaxID=2607653 RepID=A0A5B2VTP6_9BACT|nr:RDD family protein [Chitinophaga agrisoli]KAA2241626.1 RDD family protein [Chitinophaga agrisoli]